MMTPHMELPLVAFTVLSQFAIGLVLLHVLMRGGHPAAAGAPAGAAAPGIDLPARPLWIAATALLALGLLLSLLHLGHPLSAPRALSNLATSWLSREVLLASLLVALMAATVVLGVRRPLALAAAFAGLLVLIAQGMVYSPPALPALHNALPFTFFALTAIILGTGAAAWFMPRERHALPRAVLVGALCAALIVYLTAPLTWLSGDTVSAMSGQAYLASPWFWTHIVIGLVIPLVVVLASRQLPRWLPLLLLAGAVAGRIGFYADTVHAAVNLGGAY